MIKFILLLICLSISIFGGHFLTESLLEKLRRGSKNIIKPAGRNKKGDNYNWLLGGLERFVYTMALLMKFEWFIGVWLGMKGIGRWAGNNDYGVLLREYDKNPEKIIEINHARAAVVNIFLIGNLVSLIIAAFAAYLVKLAGIDCSKLF